MAFHWVWYSWNLFEYLGLWWRVFGIECKKKNISLDSFGSLLFNINIWYSKLYWFFFIAAGLSLNLASNLGLGSHERDCLRDSPTRNIDIGNGTLALRLRRLTGVDYRSRSRYIISIGDGDRRLSSGIKDDISDAEGAGSVWYPRIRLQDIASKSTYSSLLPPHQSKLKMLSYGNWKRPYFLFNVWMEEI